MELGQIEVSMMVASKKDYVAIAEILRRNKPQSTQCMDTWRQIRLDIGDYFNQNSELFNITTFLRATDAAPRDQHQH